MHSLPRFIRAYRQPIIFGATVSTATLNFESDFLSNNRNTGPFENYSFLLLASACESSSASESVRGDKETLEACYDSPYSTVGSPSWWNRLLASTGLVSLSLPRVLTSNDPAFRISEKFIRKRQRDEETMRTLVTETAPKLRGDPDLERKMELLRQEIFELAYGKGVTPQMREDFLIQYGCTGFNDTVLSRIIELCSTRGIVEVGAGHGQWQKALTDAYHATRSINENNQPKNSFDFCLAYDNNSNLPLNTHIYNQYTKPHHDHFGTVRKVESDTDLDAALRSWSCRGRALLLVYPPPGPMAMSTLRMYISVSSDNDTLIYVGEGRGGANGDDAFFDTLESGDWVLVDILEVLRPPGNKGCEKLYILVRKQE